MHFSTLVWQLNRTSISVESVHSLGSQKWYVNCQHSFLYSVLTSHSSQQASFLQQHGLAWAFMAAVSSNLPVLTNLIQIKVLGGTEKSIAAIRHAQTAHLMNTGVTVSQLTCLLFPDLMPSEAAIVAQVTVTSLQLRGVDRLHWTLSASWFCSLVLAVFAVFLSFLRHRDIVSLDNSTFRGLFVNNRGRPKIRVAAVFLLCMPYMFLHGAISFYLMGLFLYLIYNWLLPFDSTISPAAVIANRNVSVE